MKITFIMPIYNEEEALEKSITSVLKQTKDNFELILINDGSTDGSLALCQNYEKSYENIHLFTIKNSGPGFARNLGIDQATGEYLAFLDADDYLASNFIEEMMQVLDSADFDIIASHHYQVDQVDQVVKEIKTNYTSGILSKYGNTEEKERYEQYKDSSSFGYVWGKVYKSSFIKKNEIVFSEERDVFLEDTLFNLKAISYQPDYYLLDQALYYYHIYEDSLSNRKKDVSEGAIRLLEDYYQFLTARKQYDENADLIVPLVNRVIAWSLFKSLESDYRLKNSIQKTRGFSRNKTIQKILGHPKAIKELIKIESRLQTALYLFIAISIRYGLEKTLALFFYLNGPLFNLYIKKRVKR